MFLLILVEIIRWGFVLLGAMMLVAFTKLIWEDAPWYFALPVTIFLVAIGILYVLAVLTLPRIS